MPALPHLPRPKHRLPRSRKPIWVTALVAVLVAVLGGAGWLYYLNSQLADVPRISLDLPEAQRPSQAPVIQGVGKPVNILLAGADAGPGATIAEEVASGHWVPGSHRSDTIMVLHLTADRKRAFLISVPRDSWVEIPGHGQQKINAAFSIGGPNLYVQTVEKLTGLRMDHLAIIDWAGFKDLTTALGGVEVHIPETVYDSAQDITWTAGDHKLAGEDALKYVRTRHGLARGDFDRIRRQQNFMREVMHKLMSAGTMNNPLKLTRALTSITSNMTVSDTLTNSAIRDLALSLRGLDSKNVTFVTIPTVCCPYIDGQSTVGVKFDQLRDLAAAVRDDDLGPYFRRYGRDDVLGKPEDVS